MANKDSQSKRRSGLIPTLVMPSGDGTVDQGDRQHKVFKYSGILSTAPVVNYPTGTLGGKPTGAGGLRTHLATTH